MIWSRHEVSHERDLPALSVKFTLLPYTTMMAVSNLFDLSKAQKTLRIMDDSSLSDMHPTCACSNFPSTYFALGLPDSE